MKELDLILNTVKTLLKQSHIDLFIGAHEQNVRLKRKIQDELKIIYYGIGLSILYKDCNFDRKITQEIKDKYLKGIDFKNVVIDQPDRRGALYYGTLYNYFNEGNFEKRSVTAASAAFFILDKPMYKNIIKENNGTISYGDIYPETSLENFIQREIKFAYNIFNTAYQYFYESILKSKNMKSNKIYTIIAALLISFSIIVAGYFIALNNRYEKLNSTLILDKWTKNIYLIDGSFYKKME